MKIEPAPPRSTSGPTTAQAAAPSRPFADFIDDHEARAAGFAELGMFGLNRAQAAPRAAASRPTPPPAAPQEGRASPTPPPPAAAAAFPKVDQGRAPPASPTREAAAARSSPRALAKIPATACALPGEVARPIEDIAGPEEARPARVRPRQDASRPQPGFALHEEDGVVSLIAGGPPIDPEARSQLRRLVTAILARSGLSLGQFHLNGSAVAPDILKPPGGTHGPRTR